MAKRGTGDQLCSHSICTNVTNLNPGADPQSSADAAPGARQPKEMMAVIAPDSEFDSFETTLAAQAAFQRAHRLAFWQTLLGRLTGKRTELCAFHAAGIRVGARRLQEIPLNQIIGSVGRPRDYTPAFLPRRSSDEARWVRIRRIVNGTGGLPPIEVYRLGEHYFVEDGHHRVSVLKQLGVRRTEAWVTEIHPLAAPTDCSR